MTDEHNHEHADDEAHGATATVDETEAHDHAEHAEQELKEALKKVLDVQVDEAGVLRKRITISIPADTIKAERDKEFSTIFQEAIVPGFRRGRAPRRLVEKRFAREVGEQVRARLISNAFVAATEMKSLKVLGDPQVWAKIDGGEERLVDVGAWLEKLTLPEDGPLSYRCEVEVWPEFELPALEGIVVEKPRVKITDDDVSKQIDRLRAMRGTWEPLTGERVKPDDLLIADLEVHAGDTLIKKQENTQVFARPQRIEGMALETLGGILQGAAVGDTRTAEGTFPDDYEREDVRGKPARLSFKVQEIKRFNLPPLDAALLSAWGYESEDELRAFVAGQMDRELTSVVHRGMLNQIRKHLIESVKLDLPEGLSRRHVDRAIIRRAIELRREGVPAEEIEKHADELRTGAAAEALQGLKLYFIMERISEQLAVEVNEEEINSQIAEIARRYNRRFDRVRDELAQGDGLTALYLEIRDEKSLKRMLEKAEIKETEGPAQPMSALSDAT